jgi:IS4 transposase
METAYTHVLLNAVPGAYHDSELKLAQSVIPHVDSTMLLMADRNFFGYAFWTKCLATGAKFLFRVKANLRLPREQELSDGSYLSTIYPNDKDRRRRQNGIVVRVVEYALDGIDHAEPVYRLVTNWLDPEAAPAAELAALYHRRWQIETTLDEAKVHLLDGRTTLRSKTPDLVLQEFYALMITHAAIRRMMVEAAGSTEQAAEDLSYVHAVRVLKRRLPAAIAIPP